ncbi:MAG: hypothetical protein EOO38_21515 [Cytophagaceae bacterium]|nr:MAG: hypothetical protein EOO38_21515 [Cytophagaceae bacterium]
MLANAQALTNLQPKGPPALLLHLRNGRGVLIAASGTNWLGLATLNQAEQASSKRRPASCVVLIRVRNGSGAE